MAYIMKGSPFKQTNPPRYTVGGKNVKVQTGFGIEADKKLTKLVNPSPKTLKKKIARKSTGKILKQVGKRLLGPIGVAWTIYDVAKIAKHSWKSKSLKKGLKKWWNE